MSKTITSPVSDFSGTVTLKDDIFAPDFFRWRDARDDALAYANLTEDNEHERRFDIRDVPRYRAALLVGVLPILESHTLTRKNGQPLPALLTPDNFPFRPVQGALELMRWLEGEVAMYLLEEDSVPNESPPAP